MTPRPAFKDMIVSIARHKIDTSDSTFTYQFPLWALKMGQPTSQDYLDDWLSVLAAEILEMFIQKHLGIPLADISVVWSMSGSGQLAVVNDRPSLCAAIMDHQRSSKPVIQLYVVKNSSKLQNCAQMMGTWSADTYQT